jgi:hypothetical protein
MQRSLFAVSYVVHGWLSLQGGDQGHGEARRLSPGQRNPMALHLRASGWRNRLDIRGTITHSGQVGAGSITERGVKATAFLLLHP